MRAERTIPPALPPEPPASAGPALSERIPGEPPDPRALPEARGAANMSRAAAWIATIVTLAALALARHVLVPLAMAGLLAYLLMPLATGLERLRVKRGFAAALSVLCLGTVLGGLLALLASQAMDLSDSLPRYRDQLRLKAEALQGTSLGGPARAAEQLNQLGEAITPAAGETPGPKPMRVEVVENRPSSFDRVIDLVGPVLPVLGLTVVVLLVTVFLLTFRLDLRERFIRVVSLGEIALTASALDDASSKISRYLLMMLFVNATFGTSVATAMWLLGLPNAPLWGLLAALLRFVPLIGVWIAAVPPLLLAIAIFPTWGPTLVLLAIWAVAEVLVANVLEPLVIGWRTGLSPFAVVLSTLLWTWLWGPAGLLLAVPVTLCLAVAGRYFRPLRFVSVLFGAESSLSAHHRLYERLLASDPGGARQTVHTAIAAGSADAAIDGVLAPALALAVADRRRGAIGTERFEAVCETARLLADELDEGPAPESKRDGGEAGRVLVVPVATPAEGVLAELLAARLARLSVPAASVPPTMLAGELTARIDEETPAVVVLVGLPPLGALWIRYLAKRLKSRAPGFEVVAVLWPDAAPPAPPTDADLGGLVAHVAAGFADAVERIRVLAERPVPEPATAAATA
jgi:predicted PurR-regulated permease PerM